MSSLTRYVFRSSWIVDASPRDAFAVLRDVARYPVWWPEVKQVREIAPGFFKLRVRSLLPYDLHFTLETARDDPGAGVLEAKLSGNLAGATRWTIASHSQGACITFDEDVVTNKPLLRLLAPIGRAAFNANHALMMRHGEAGLRIFLAGMRFGRSR